MTIGDSLNPNMGTHSPEEEDSFTIMLEQLFYQWFEIKSRTTPLHEYTHYTDTHIGVVYSKI